jgi:hypothetical protein
MKVWKNHLVTILFALASVSFFLPVVIQLIEGEPLNATFLVFALAFFALAVVFLAVGGGRKAGGGSGPARAEQGTFRGDQ